MFRHISYMCFLRYLTCENFLSQTSHRCSVLASSCSRLCLYRLFLYRNVYLQSGHECLLSLLWLSMWSWSSRFSSKPTWQTSHLNLWFPASLSWCRFNSELVRKALLQLVPTKVLLLWAFICLSMLVSLWKKYLSTQFTIVSSSHLLSQFVLL